jgi:outer membrane protein assembly factor BamB
MSLSERASRIKIFSAFLTIILAFAAIVQAEDWVQWRGPTADGIAGNQARPPLHWDSQTNIAWIADVPGEGSSTPIVIGDQVIVLSAEKTSRKSPNVVANDERAKTVPDEFFYRFLVTSLDRSSGVVRWQKTATEQVPHEGRHSTNTYAAGSPTTDGERIYASFGSRGVFCYSMAGELIWDIDLGDMRTRFGWGEAVTPVLANNLLIVNWDQEENSFIIAIDKRTGKTAWKKDRPGEPTSWNTPLVTELDGKQIVVVNGTGSVKAYDAETGNILWACSGQTTNAIPSPIRFQDLAICMSGYRGACAVAIPLTAQGDVTGSSSVRWQINQGTPYVPSPVISGNRLFFTGGNTDILSCIDATTGKPLNERKRLSGVVSLYASPVLANGHLYFTGREGTTVVVKDNANLEVVAVNSLDDAIDASPVAVDRQLFLRSWTKVYCLQENATSSTASPPAARKTSVPDNLLGFQQVNLEASSETSANASIGDLDRDGDLDIVLAKGRHWPLHNQVLLNDGKAGFATSMDLGVSPDRTYSTSLADLDLDGDLDIVVSNDSPDGKFIYLNDGKANFKVSGTWGQASWNTRNTCLSDLNADNFPDLVVANRQSSSFIVINDGKARFNMKSSIEIASESATTIVPADFNGDGHIDLAIPHRDGGQSKTHWNDGKLGFSSTTAFGPAECSSRAAAAGDLNSDGRIDLVVGDERRGSLVLLNDGQGAFQDTVLPLDQPQVPYSIALGDMNDDGRLDIIVGYAKGLCSIYMNDGSGQRYEHLRFGDGKGSVYGIALGDLDQDGKLDIAAARSEAPNAVFLSHPK